MRYRIPLFTAFAALMFTLVSCSSDSQSNDGGNQVSYKDVKSMVIDILGSEDAQKVISKASSSQSQAHGSMLIQSSALSPQDQQVVQLAVKDVLTSPEYSRVIESVMKDPKFAGEFARSVSKQDKQIHKDLMKDPGYQKDLVDTFKNPEMQRVLSDSMKTTEFRQQMMAGVTEAIQNPMFKLEIMKLLQSAVKEELTPKQASKQGGKGGGGGSKGGGGGGGGGAGGGDGGGGG